MWVLLIFVGKTCCFIMVRVGLLGKNGIIKAVQSEKSTVKLLKLRRNEVRIYLTGKNSVCNVLKCFADTA